MAHDLEAVVRPVGTEEVTALICACAEEDTRSRGPRGRQQPGCGAVPLASGVVLSLDRLTHPEIHVANTVAVAGACVITRQLGVAANAYWLVYPADPA